MALSINELKNGVTVLVDGDVYIVIDAQHVKPGKGAAFVRTKLKNLETLTIIDRTFRGDEKIEDAFVEQKRLAFLYSDANIYHFMDQATYEELSLPAERLIEKKNFLKDNLEVTALLYNHRLLDIELPTFINLKVTSTEAGLRGDTAKQATKPAILETGVKIGVPLFVEVGDIIKVDTRTAEYVERV